MNEGKIENLNSNQKKEWEEIIEQIKAEVQNLSPDEIIEKYIEAMAQSNALGQKGLNGENISKGSYEESQDRKLAIATLVKDLKSSFSSEEIIKKIKERTEELLKK